MYPISGTYKTIFFIGSIGSSFLAACGVYFLLVRVFSDVLVAFLCFDICHYRQSNLAIENPDFSQPVVAGHIQ